MKKKEAEYSYLLLRGASICLASTTNWARFCRFRVIRVIRVKRTAVADLGMFPAAETAK
jgi:hypothetical protein